MPVTEKRAIEAGRQRGGRVQFRRRITTRSGWTVGALVDLRDLSISFRGDLTEIAVAMGTDRLDCDIALNALIGRSPAEAFAALEARE